MNKWTCGEIDVKKCTYLLLENRVQCSEDDEDQPNISIYNLDVHGSLYMISRCHISCMESKDINFILIPLLIFEIFGLCL